MATTAEGHPITRAELREELQDYATKADVASLETRMVKWIAGLVLGGVTAAVGLTAVVVRVAGG